LVLCLFMILEERGVSTASKRIHPNLAELLHHRVISETGGSLSYADPMHSPPSVLGTSCRPLRSGGESECQICAKMTAETTCCPRCFHGQPSVHAKCEEEWLINNRKCMFCRLPVRKTVQSSCVLTWKWRSSQNKRFSGLVSSCKQKNALAALWHRYASLTGRSALDEASLADLVVRVAALFSRGPLPLWSEEVGLRLARGVDRMEQQRLVQVLTSLTQLLPLAAAMSGRRVGSSAAEYLGRQQDWRDSVRSGLTTASAEYQLPQERTMHSDSMGDSDSNKDNENEEERKTEQKISCGIADDGKWRVSQLGKRSRAARFHEQCGLGDGADAGGNLSFLDGMRENCRDKERQGTPWHETVSPVGEGLNDESAAGNVNLDGMQTTCQLGVHQHNVMCNDKATGKNIRLQIGDATGPWRGLGAAARAVMARLEHSALRGRFLVCLLVSAASLRRTSAPPHSRPSEISEQLPVNSWTEWNTSTKTNFASASVAAGEREPWEVKSAAGRLGAVAMRAAAGVNCGLEGVAPEDLIRCLGAVADLADEAALDLSLPAAAAASVALTEKRVLNRIKAAWVADAAEAIGSLPRPPSMASHVDSTHNGNAATVAVRTAQESLASAGALLAVRARELARGVLPSVMVRLARGFAGMKIFDPCLFSVFEEQLMQKESLMLINSDEAKSLLEAFSSAGSLSESLRSSLISLANQPRHPDS